MWGGGSLLQRHTHRSHTVSGQHGSHGFWTVEEGWAKPRRDNLPFCFYVSRSRLRLVSDWGIDADRLPAGESESCQYFFPTYLLFLFSVTTDKRKRGVKYDPVDAAPWYDHSGRSMLTAQELLTTSRVLGSDSFRIRLFFYICLIYFMQKMKLDVKKKSSLQIFSISHVPNFVVDLKHWTMDKEIVSTFLFYTISSFMQTLGFKHTVYLKTHERKHKRKWKTYLSVSNTHIHTHTHTCISLCEDFLRYNPNHPD